MTGNLLVHGLPAFGHDVAEAAVSGVAAAGATPVATPTAVARAAPIAITSLPTSAALAAVVAALGGLREADRAGLTVIETSTLALAEKEAAHRE